MNSILTIQSSNSCSDADDTATTGVHEIIDRSEPNVITGYGLLTYQDQIIGGRPINAKKARRASMAKYNRLPVAQFTFDDPDEVTSPVPKVNPRMREAFMRGTSASWMHKRGLSNSSTEAESLTNLYTQL